MNDLHRELAPISTRGWQEIEEEAKRTLRTFLAARKLVEFVGPLGWEASSVPLGRVSEVQTGPVGGVAVRERVVQPLVELRAPFALEREEIDAIDRGAADPDLGPLEEAARVMAHAEDHAVFYGMEAGVNHGIIGHSVQDPLPLSDDYLAYPETVARAIERLREAGVAGPYAIALGPRCFTGLAETTAAGGYPVIRHVERLLDGPVVWAPAVDGAVVLSLRGGDFELTVGRDLSIGYAGHDAERVELYLVESLAFRLLGPEAAVPLHYTSGSGGRGAGRPAARKRSTSRASRKKTGGGRRTRRGR